MATKSGIPRLIVSKKVVADANENNVNDNEMESESEKLSQPPKVNNKPSKPSHIMLVDVSGKVGKCATHLQPVHRKITVASDKTSASTKNAKKIGVISLSNDAVKILALPTRVPSMEITERPTVGDSKSVNKPKHLDSIDGSSSNDGAGICQTITAGCAARDSDIVCSSSTAEDVSKNKIKKIQDSVQSCKKTKSNETRRSIKRPTLNIRRSLKQTTNSSIVKEGEGKSQLNPLHLQVKHDKTKMKDEIRGKESAYNINKEKLSQDYQQAIVEKEEYKQELTAMKSILVRNGIDPVELKSLAVDEQSLSAKRDESLKMACALRETLLSAMRRNKDTITAMSAVVGDCSTTNNAPSNNS